MQFLFVIVLLAAVLSAEIVSAEPVAHSGMRVLLTAGTIALVMLFAQFAAGITTLRLKRNFSQQADWMKTYSRWRTFHLVLWALGSVTILYGLEWTRLVRVNWQLAGSFLIDEVLILLPVVSPLLFSWAAFYEVDRTFENRAAQRQGLVMRPWLSGCVAYVLTHVRHHLGILLLPLLLLIAFQDAALWLWPMTDGSDLPLVAYLPVLLAMVILLPFLLRCVWPTESLPTGELRTRLQGVSRRLGISVRDIFVWKTNRMITNAAVAGFLPRLRYVFLSDSLLMSLEKDQLAAIYAHELGHVRYHHLPLRVMTSLLPLGVWMALCETFPAAVATLDATIQGMGLSVVALSPLLLLAVMIVYARTVMAWYSRLLEHQADVVACCDVMGDDANPLAGCVAMTSAATETFVAALSRLTRLSGQSDRRRSWLHPSTHDRVVFLRAMADDSAAFDRFETRMRRSARLFVLLFLSVIVWWSTAISL